VTSVNRPSGGHSGINATGHGGKHSHV